MLNNASEIVKIYDLTPIHIKNETLRFRIEILKKLNENHYYANVYRIDTYRIQPTFTIDASVSESDESFYVFDHHFQNIQGDSMESVLSQIESIFKKIFGDILG